MYEKKVKKNVMPMANENAMYEICKTCHARPMKNAMYEQVKADITRQKKNAMYEYIKLP